MARINVCGDAVVIKSELTLDTIEMVQKYKPEALCVWGGENNKEKLFEISVGDRGCGCGAVGKYGIEFTKAEDNGSGNAYVTTVSPCGEPDVDAIIDDFGGIVENLNTIEAGLGAALEAIEESRQKIRDSITMC